MAKRGLAVRSFQQLADEKDRTRIKVRAPEAIGSLESFIPFAQDFHSVRLVRMDLDLDRVDDVWHIGANGHDREPVVAAQKESKRETTRGGWSSSVTMTWLDLGPITS